MTRRLIYSAGPMRWLIGGTGLLIVVALTGLAHNRFVMSRAMFVMMLALNTIWVSVCVLAVLIPKKIADFIVLRRDPVLLNSASEGIRWIWCLLFLVPTAACSSIAVQFQGHALRMAVTWSCVVIGVLCENAVIILDAKKVIPTRWRGFSAWYAMTSSVCWAAIIVVFTRVKYWRALSEWIIHSLPEAWEMQSIW